MRVSISAMSIAGSIIWLLFQYGLPKTYVPAITSTYSVQFAAFSLLGIAGACFVALWRMR